MQGNLTYPLSAREIARKDYETFSQIVDDISRKYDITDSDQFESALERWWAGNPLEEIIEVNPLMEYAAFYEVAGRCEEVMEPA